MRLPIASPIALIITAIVLLAGFLLAACKQLGVKSYGMPAGRVVRAGSNLAVLIQTRDPYFPSPKGVSEDKMTYSYAMWLIPETAQGDTRVIPLDKHVRSSARTHNIGAQRFQSGILWYTIDDLRGLDISTGKPTTQAPPASLVNAPISALMGSNQPPADPYRVRSVLLSGGTRLAVATDDELTRDFKPGSRLSDDSSSTATYKPRKLFAITSQSGPIPRVESATPLLTPALRSASFMRADVSAPVVRFTNPEGFLVMHEDGDVIRPTLRLSRLNADGTIAWTVDTQIQRLTQILPDPNLPAFVGERKPTTVEPEPALAVVDLRTGTVSVRSLLGPLN